MTTLPQLTRPLQSVLLLMTFSLCLLQVGCAAEAPARVQLPSYEWINAEQGVHLVNQRATSLDTIFALGNVTLDIPEHKDVKGNIVKASNTTMQAMVIAFGQDHLRFRAWQKKSPVIDITLTPDGMWIWYAPDKPILPLSTKQLRKLPQVLHGNLPAKTSVVKDASLWLTLSESFPKDGKPVQYLMHKPTLTVRRFEFMDSKQNVIEAINLENYELIDMYPWPDRLIASSARGSMQIDFLDVQLNSKLPQDAFVPQAQAVKQP